MPQNGRKSFGHKAAEEEDEDGFTLFSYNTPVARLERSDDGSHLDFILLSNDYLSGTTMNHIHSFLISHKQNDIPTKKLKMMQVGDKVPLMAAESRKLVKEGAGAGYTVTIKDLKLGSILDKKYVKMKKDYESYWECQVEVMPGEYEIEASDYYNDFFWQEHEFGDKATAKIDGGIATISYSTNSYDEDEAEDELRHEVARRTMDVSFDYGWGWTHADLPREKIEANHVDASGEFYGSIDKLELDAPDLADAVNGGFQSTFGDGEDEEPFDGLTNESYDDRWMEVGAGFGEFRQRLWNHARKDVKNRKDAFSRCMDKCEEALKEYHDTVLPEEDPHSSTRMF